MIGAGRENAGIKRRFSGKCGPRSKRQTTIVNVGDHLPSEGPSRRRCQQCSRNNKATRTKLLATFDYVTAISNTTDVFN
ncbi:unnamed protein product [Acanthoscelides obtectus]|uniref:Uncharacterized protein n=1 Tax=Acanthoscelides obtectus TaxID=200917 RepID=A0A9P0L1V4_ACAOB|nr:unnamed protein product [Acanthoscelides obtectus]CAK1639261.1 hypothetical protein AOBTE_LOCUS11076 [Acanthoscelides obtectus]